MLVDPQPPPSSSSSFSPTFPASFEDFFNMDLFSSSRSSSSSPHSPVMNSFPYTPPQQTPLQSFFPSSYDTFSGSGAMDLSGTAADPSEFLNIYLDEDYSKPMMMIPPVPPSGTTPYDFLGAFGALTSSSSTASSSSSYSPGGESPHITGTSGDGASPQQMMMATIDPQLVGTPSTSRAMSEFEADDERHDEEDEEDNEEEEDGTGVGAGAAPTPQVIAPVKVGGKGKGRKGTVASGGINKKSSVSSSLPSAGKENVASKDSGKVEDRESEDWRPSPEEYKKMSSKEKRQLRNKISARNFRVRRKEYISTLEADISERDALISAIRSELGSSKSENVALRQEITALKKALLAGRGVGETPVLPPPAPLSVPSPTATSPPASTSQTSNSVPAVSSPLITPNTQKDLPTSPRLNARGGFWGGAMGGTPGLGGGYTPVHTTFVPSMPLPLGVGTGVRLGRKNSVQENINPNLNRVPSPPIIDPSPFANIGTKKVNNNSGNGSGGARANAGAAGLDTFMDMNPFTLKTLDAYRMQLWGRMAAQTHQYQQQQLYHHQQHQLTGLAEKLRPQFFRDSQSFSAVSGKVTMAGASISGSASAGAAGTKDWKEKEQRDAMYASAAAALASQTLLGKLGSAFWDAFSGSHSNASGSPALGAWKQWDADKVRKVLEGKAVVRVVDVESPTSSPKIAAAQSQTSSPKMPSASTSTNGGGGCSSDRCRYVTDILEESMRSLSLGKK